MGVAAVASGIKGSTIETFRYKLTLKGSANASTT